MASNLSLRSSNFFDTKAVLSEDRFNFKLHAPCACKMNVKGQEMHRIPIIALPMQFIPTHVSTSQILSSKFIPRGALSPLAANSHSSSKENYPLAESLSDLKEFDRVNILVRFLHEFATSSCQAMEKCEFAKTGPPLAMAWSGVDVRAWYKHIAYQVAAYALLKAATIAEHFPVKDDTKKSFPVEYSVIPVAMYILDHIERQLNERNPKLVEFGQEEFKRFIKFFSRLLMKWYAEDDASDLAGTILGITCCAAVRKIGSDRFSCSTFSDRTHQALVELLDFVRGQASLNKLHRLATEAGFEHDFLSHFGTKVFPTRDSEELVFWIGLAKNKLSVALEREGIIKDRRDLSNKAQENTLTALALFSYLGRESRLFMSRHNVNIPDNNTSDTQFINDTEDHIKDFLRYLECGILFIYPEFSKLSLYQLLMEVTIDEIGWFDLYAPYDKVYQVAKRSKEIPVQAQMEIVFYTVFAVCSDTMAGFANYKDSRRLTLDPRLIDFVHQSTDLLSASLQKYRAAYDRAVELHKEENSNVARSAASTLINGMENASPVMEALLDEQIQAAQDKTSVDLASDATLKSIQDFLKMSVKKLEATTVDVWMGTQLLFVDISDTSRFLGKKLRGHKLTERQGRKMKRTLKDIATLIPVMILMLLPVSAVGHAAMFAAINKYFPWLIPSTYSDERINLVKRFKNTKKMEIKRADIEDDTDSKSV